MSRKRCNRRIWKLVDPINHVITGLAPVKEKELEKLLLRELSSLEAMSKGQGTIQEWTDLNSVLGLCETMAKNNVGAEALQACQDLQDDLILAARRYESTRKMGLTAKGIQAARDVIEYHHLQRQSVSLSDYERTIYTLQQKIRNKHKDVIEL